MNFLGHLFLSPATPDDWLGSLLGDFVKGPIENAGYNAVISRAIRLHRAIDTFTDAHPQVRQSKQRISAERRRYAGVMMDLFYDHFLARYWNEFHDEPLPQFAQRVYTALESTPHPLPERFLLMRPYFIQQDWLNTYRDIEGIDATLNRMSRRLSRGEPLRASTNELRQNYEQLESDFRAFIPSAIEYARSNFSNAVH